MQPLYIILSQYKPPKTCGRYLHKKQKMEMTTSISLFLYPVLLTLLQKGHQFMIYS
jgi:hypothetical protein